MDNLLKEAGMKLLVAAVIAVLCAGCGGDSPTGPSPVPNPLPPAAPLTVTISGHLTATNGGQALPDVQAVLGATTATTDGSGSFNASVQPSAAARLSLTGSGIVPRSLMVAAAGNRDLAVDAIALGGSFDLNFYQQLVRDSLESPSPQPLRRWTANPSLYLQANGLADARTLAMVEQVARAAVPQWTNGAFNVAAVEQGSGSRAGQAGWLTVLFSAEVTKCGTADIGLSGGTIILYPKAPNCGCNGYSLRPSVVRHEVGHAMGFYHTDNAADVMSVLVATQCDTQPSARERYHAAIAYNRPVGNVAPDTDGAGVSLAPMRVVQ